MLRASVEHVSHQLLAQVHHPSSSPPHASAAARSVLGRLDLLGKLNRHESKPLVLWLQSLTEISANGTVTINFIMLLDGRKTGPSPIFLTGHQRSLELWVRRQAALAGKAKAPAQLA